MERATIVQYWHEVPPPDVACLIATFADMNPGMEHRLFDAREAEAFIEGHFTAREVNAFRACAAPTMQADYFRYCAILALGGIYSDSDFRCVAELDALLPERGYGRLFGGREGHVVNGVFAFGSGGHEFLKLALEIATLNIERRISEEVYFLTGPPIFSILVWLSHCGSFKALADKLKGTQFGYFAEFYCEAIGDYGRICSAMHGIEILPLAEGAFVRPSKTRLLYKDSEMHWGNMRGSPFR